MTVRQWFRILRGQEFARDVLGWREPEYVHVLCGEPGGVLTFELRPYYPPSQVIAYFNTGQYRALFRMVELRDIRDVQTLVDEVCDVWSEYVLMWGDVRIPYKNIHWPGACGVITDISEPDGY